MKIINTSYCILYGIVDPSASFHASAYKLKQVESMSSMEKHFFHHHSIPSNQIRNTHWKTSQLQQSTMASSFLSYHIANPRSIFIRIPISHCSLFEPFQIKQCNGIKPNSLSLSLSFFRQRLPLHKHNLYYCTGTRVSSFFTPPKPRDPSYSLTHAKNAHFKFHLIDLADLSASQGGPSKIRYGDFLLNRLEYKPWGLWRFHC